MMNYYKTLVCLVLMLLAASPVIMAQRNNGGGTAISHRDTNHDRDKRPDDEFSMSHFDAFAGELIGLVLPKRMMEMPVSKGWWEAVESDRVKIVEHTGTSASVRLLKSGTTVVNYKYKIVREGREVSESYPFTIRVHRIDPEVVQLPSTIYVGWDVSENLQNRIHMLPEYSEAHVMLSLEDPNFADIDEGYDGMRITGRNLGETTLYVETGNGIKTKTRIVVVEPELKSIDIKAPDKTMKPREMMQLSLKIYPVRATAQVTWTTDRPEVVSIDQNGVVTAWAEGKATIKVIAENGVKDSITIKVKK